MLRDCINDSLLKDTFPDSLKLENVTPVHKQDEPTDKENYGPGVSTTRIYSGLLLFNLLINELFLFVERMNMYNFADDNTIYRRDCDLEIVLQDLQHNINILFNWLKLIR